MDKENCKMKEFLYLNDECNKQNQVKRTNTNQNKLVGECSEGGKEVCVIKLVEQNTVSKNLNNPSHPSYVSNEKNVENKMKDRIKLNLCRKESETNKIPVDVKENEVIELSDNEEEGKLEDIIDIDLEDEELYNDIDCCSSPKSGHCSDSGDILITYDRKKDKTVQEIIIVEDEEEEKNEMNKSAKDLQTYYKTLRLNENISYEERRILQSKMFCEFDKVFKDTYTCYFKNQRWFYTCHLCKVIKLPFKDLLNHIQGNRHKRVSCARRITPDQCITIQDTEKKFICEIDNDLKSITKPLVGLEYLLESVTSSTQSTQPSLLTVDSYYCALCGTKKSSRRSILAHLTSFQHYDTFLTKFFPTASKKIRSFIVFKKDLVRIKFLEHVVGRIEYIFGRLQPSQISVNVMETSRTYLTQKIEESPFHFWETPEKNLADCIDEAHINSAQCIVGWINRQKYNPTSGTYPPVFKRVDLHKNGSTVEINNQMQDNHSGLKYSAQVIHPVKPFYHGQTVQPTTSSGKIELLDRFDGEERAFYEMLLSGQDPSLWEKYKQTVERLESNIIKDFDYYNEYPENHSQYQDKLKQFWISERKPKNLQSSVVPFAGSNEFMLFWKNSLAEIYEDIFKCEKNKIKKQFVDKYWHLKDMHKHHSELLCVPFNQQHTEIDKRRPYKRNYSPEKYSNTYKRSKIYFDSISTTQPRDKSRILPTSSKPTATVSGIIQSEDETKIIPVLRYISVLESHLGSLGPKVLNLLSSAISLEKSKNITSILLTRKENCIFLYMVKEKLIGLLEANILEKPLIIVAENAIKKIDFLLPDNTVNQTNNNIVNEMPVCSKSLLHNNKMSTILYLTLTEIPTYITKHDALSHLTFLQRTEITQKIGSDLIVQNRMKVSIEDLEILIQETAKKLNVPLREGFAGKFTKHRRSLEDFPNNKTFKQSNRDVRYRK